MIGSCGEIVPGSCTAGRLFLALPPVLFLAVCALGRLEGVSFASDWALRLAAALVLFVAVAAIWATGILDAANSGPNLLKLKTRVDPCLRFQGSTNFRDKKLAFHLKTPLLV
jgi:hypothetical protein